MKYFIASLFLILIAGAPVKAQTEQKTASTFMTAVKNDVYSLFAMQIADKADKKALELKFNKLVENIAKSGMQTGKINLKSNPTKKLGGLNATTMVIVYEYEGVEWDDVVLLLESSTYQIQDIGAPDKAFKRDETQRGNNYKNHAALAKYFFPNAAHEDDAMAAARNMIRVANADKLEEFIPLIAYKGTDDPNRVSLATALNPKIEKDRERAKRYLSDIRGRLNNPESIYLQGGFEAHPSDGSCYFRVVCDDNKNTAQFRFVVRKGKYLLSEFY